MGAPLEDELLTLNCLSREADRVDYAEYVFSGKIFVKDDRPAVCANPTRRRGDSGNRVMYRVTHQVVPLVMFT